VFKEADPTRPVSLIVGGAWDKNDQAGLPLIADVIAYNGGACRLEDEEIVHERTGLRFDWPPKMFRRLYPKLRHIGSEGILNHYIIRRGDWDTELTQWQGQAREWDEIYAHDWFSGMAMWVFSDWSANGELRVRGAVDRFRLPSTAYRFYQAMWGRDPVVHVVGHWNWTPGEPREIAVFSNGTGVELILNGRSLGPGESTRERWPHLPHPPTVWRNVPFEPGELVARADCDGRSVEHRVVTHGAASAIELDLLTDRVRADGRDISYVTVLVKDDGGHLCSTWDGSVRAEVTGAGRLAGPAEVEVLAGLGRFAVRSTGEPGNICVSVAGEELSIAADAIVAAHKAC
jgi:hypothetical protein